MKVLLSALCLLAASSQSFAQSPYVSFKDLGDPKQHILNGIITKYALQNDSTYQWYASSERNYTPSAELVAALQNASGKTQLVIFGGTWCEDTHFVLPKFFKAQAQANYPDDAISFFAVDRNKKTIGGITGAFKIINVPTIIVMKDGKEVGRVVEYGKTGQWDKELAALLQ
jgi:thiol-disulfide isomerase/thioredoxin